ncbi:hypothetical protein ES288_D02G004100v1 [Gossypium darwinii]|uniref:Secreted protein n=1 Tax=Gossypium darwinii TaxID=34276 RepID=A0A5D2D8R8_GOSDA|nr:hypothetical protein ES288_D02G004000v1 [Gossypium darwinii]TYG77794.1 hypothetical protein ES288_D02G004100v1 [Gossypium darwinii]
MFQSRVQKKYCFFHSLLLCCCCCCVLFCRRCQTHGGEGHARGVVVVVRKVAHGWPSVRRLEAWGSKLGFAENGVNLGLGLCLFWV